MKDKSLKKKKRNQRGSLKQELNLLLEANLCTVGHTGYWLHACQQRSYCFLGSGLQPVHVTQILNYKNISN